MSKFFFPIHLNGDNRGCEAIAKGTVEVLKLNPEEYVGLSTDVNLDTRLGLSEINTLIKSKQVSQATMFMFRVFRKLFHKEYLVKKGIYKEKYDHFLNSIGKDDICMITGGDMFCYGDNELNYIVNRLYIRDVKSVLWGCSFGSENLTPAKSVVLKKFAGITTRESLTYNYFVNELKLKNVMLVADPAFTLKKEKTKLPEYFDKDVLGINLSNFVSEKYSSENTFFSSFMKFIDYVVKNTNLQIVLIPHVFWNGQDDREVCKLIADKYGQTDRIKTLDTEKMNYCQIRYIISKCKYFMGARTHAMISAYSTCTPALALGYSIKSKGIAKDLGLDSKLVLDYRTVKNENDIIERFKYLVDNSESIRAHLEKIMPDYIKKAYLGKDIIEKL